MRNTHSINLLPPPSTTRNIQFLTNVSFTGWNRGWKLSDSMIRKAIRFALLVVMLGSGRVTAQVTEVTEGFGNVYGGGNKGRVDGNATVNIKD